MDLLYLLHTCSVGCPDLFRTDSVSDTKMGISRTLSDMYAQEWHAKGNIPSKRKHYLIFNDNFETDIQSTFHFLLF